MKNKVGQKGFTLVEMMIVVAIVGIICAVGTTLLLNYLPNMRLKSASRDIFSALLQAKTEAVQRGTNVTLRFNPPLAPYAPADARIPLNSYVIFIDNGAGGGVADDEIINGTEPILVAATPLPAGISLDPAISGRGTNFASDAVVFTSRGIPINAFNGGLGSGTVRLRTTDSNGNTVRQRTITVSSAGRININ
jgi:type IV fimbrial biogenesis protein FimT